MSKLKIILILVSLIFSNFVYGDINQEKTDKLLCVSELNKLTKNKEEKELDIKLKNILRGVGKYCTSLEEESIYFYCEEHVTENIYNQIKTRIKRNNYVYSYQLVEKNNVFQETRKLIRNSGSRRRYDWDSTSVIFKKIIFGPQGIFGLFWQAHYNYKIIGEDILDKKKTIIIEAIPKNPLKKNSVMKNNLLYGKAWIKADDYTVLKIEWDPKSVAYANNSQKFSKNQNSNLRLSLTTEYLFEKNGIRYPTKGLYSEYTVNKKKKKQILLTLSAKYKKFKFFKVDTETRVSPIKIEK